jgi:ABC-2 type transport system ATP-binding protein
VTQPLSPLALEVRALEKRFDHPAVDGLDLSVPAGEFFTLLGPNGAGKTTTLRLVTGLLKPDRGSIAVYGIDAPADPIAARRIMAWVSDEPMIYEKLTPMEYLDFVGGLWAVESNRAAARARDLLGWLGLAPHADERCEQLSKGARRWHWPARLCTSRSSSCWMNHSPAWMLARLAWSRRCCGSVSVPGAP